MTRSAALVAILYVAFTASGCIEYQTVRDKVLLNTDTRIRPGQETVSPPAARLLRQPTGELMLPLSLAVSEVMQGPEEEVATYRGRVSKTTWAPWFIPLGWVVGVVILPVMPFVLDDPNVKRDDERRKAVGCPLSGDEAFKGLFAGIFENCMEGLQRADVAETRQTGRTVTLTRSVANRPVRLELWLPKAPGPHSLVWSGNGRTDAQGVLRLGGEEAASLTGAALGVLREGQDHVRVRVRFGEPSP